MAKVKSAGLRNYIGRLGGNVYYLNRGQQISRELAPQVSNPRTPAQMRQRMKWANIVNFYKANRAWMGNLSFEGKPTTQSDYNAFMAANIGQNPVYLTKQMQENGACILAPYIMTKGSLGPVSLRFDAVSDFFVSSIDVDITESFAELTVGQLSDAIVKENGDWQFGDQLSAIVMFMGRTYIPFMHAIEIVLDSTDGRLVDEVVGTEELFTKSGTKLAVYADALTNPTLGTAAACTIVHSRTISGKTAVSTQSMVLNTDALITYAANGTEEQFRYAAESYGMGAAYFLAAGYQDYEEGSTEQGFRRIDGAYPYYDQTRTFTLTNGGRNTFAQGVGEVTPTGATVLTISLNQPLTDGNTYHLWFRGQSGFVEIDNEISDGTRTIEMRCTYENAANIVGRAGSFMLFAEAGTEGTPVATMYVSE